MQAYSESVSGLKRLRNDPQANTMACLIGVRGILSGYLLSSFGFFLIKHLIDVYRIRETIVILQSNLVRRI